MGNRRGLGREEGANRGKYKQNNLFSMGNIIEIFVNGNKTNAQLVFDSIEFNDKIMSVRGIEELISDMRIIKDYTEED